ncbi:MAG: AAA family ATPase [Solirubrobacterales bacterium]
MGYRVVAISPTDGSAGEALGAIVAYKLGFRLINEQVVARVAWEAGVDPEVVADVERRKSVVARVLGGLGAVAPAATAELSGSPIVDDSAPRRDALRGLIRNVLWESAEAGDAVIVAHAASLALAARADVLRVLITASVETRARRLAEAQKIGEPEAEKLVARGDANRADYLKRFYDVSTELPTHYDISLNTDHLAQEDVVTLILGAARSQQIPA